MVGGTLWLVAWLKVLAVRRELGPDQFQPKGRLGLVERDLPHWIQVGRWPGGPGTRSPRSAWSPPMT